MQRRAITLGLDAVATALDGICTESLDSLPRAAGRLRDAEQKIEAAEDQAFDSHAIDLIPRARNWPYGNTPTRMVLQWLRQEPGAPTDFKDWMPATADLGAQQLINALWWMWKRKPAIDREDVERFVIAFAQFLGFDPEPVDIRDESWCIRASLPGLAPIWLPGLGCRDQQRLDILVVDGESDPASITDLSLDCPCLLLGPFDVLERPPRGVITLSVTLLLRLIPKDGKTRTQLLLGALGRQIEADRILPEDPIGGDAGSRPWPESDLADRFLRDEAGNARREFDESHRFLHRFLYYHGVRCERARS